MKMLSNRTGGIPALIFAVLMMIAGFSAQNVNAQYNNNYGDYNDGYYDNDYGDYQEFYDDLSPHGQWLNDPQYGYVWTPNVGRDFRPYYTNGHWVMTEYGNMWVSDYSWGWAPFHYGRWAQSAYYGWIWIPGRTWGPAWVTWRQGGGYYGWAPMGPGISINFSFGTGYNAPNAWWTFIPCGNIYSRSYYRYYSPRQTVNIINNTTIINNTYVDHRARNTYVTGPRRSDVETATRQRVTVYNINNRGRAGASEISGRNVSVYRPSVRAINTRSQERPAPRQVKSLDRSVVTNAGGGRAPSRQQIDNGNRGREATERPQMQRDNNTRDNQRVQRDLQQQQREQQMMQRTRDRDQQIMQQRGIQQQQAQRDAADKQRALREQQVQQQRMQRDQQMEQQRMQQRQAEQQQRMQRDQQVQQQRMQQQQMEQQQRMQREQQMQQQRAQERQMEQQQRMRDQQMQQQRAQQREIQQQQRSVERAQPQRSEPQPQRSVERAPRGR